MDKSKIGRLKRELREERDKIADLNAAIKELEEDSKGASQGEEEEKSCGDDIPLDADARESEWKVRCVFVGFFRTRTRLYRFLNADQELGIDL